MILGPDSLPEIIGRIREQAAALEMPVTRIREYIRRLKDEGGFAGIESLIPLIYPDAGTIFDYMPPGTLFILSDPENWNGREAPLRSRSKKIFRLPVKRGICACVRKNLISIGRRLKRR